MAGDDGEGGVRVPPWVLEATAGAEEVLPVRGKHHRPPALPAWEPPADAAVLRDLLDALRQL